MLIQQPSIVMIKVVVTNDSMPGSTNTYWLDDFKIEDNRLLVHIGSIPIDEGDKISVSLEVTKL